MRAHYEQLWADAPVDPEPWEWERRRALLLSEARAGETVLDLGCGAGRFVHALNAAGARAIGVELAAAALDRARKNAPNADLRLVAPDGSLPLGHGEVDLVWCSEVLEHVADTAHILLEVRRVLKPDGRLLVTVPYHGRIRAAAIALTRFERHFDPTGDHLRFYTRRSLQTTLQDHGFDHITIEASPRIGLTARARRAGPPAAAAGAQVSG